MNRFFLLLLICSSCGINEDINCYYRYLPISCDTDNICFARKVCDKGAFEESFTGYCLVAKNCHVDLDISDNELYDTVFWEIDTVTIIFDDFQFAFNEGNSSIQLKIADKKITVKKACLSQLSSKINLLDSTYISEENWLFKYYYSNDLNNHINTQYSINSNSKDLPIKGNIIQASNAFYISYLDKIEVDSGKINIQYKAAGKEFIFFIDTTIVNIIQIN